MPKICLENAEQALFDAFTKFKMPIFESRINTSLGILDNSDFLISKNFIERIAAHYRRVQSSKYFSRHYLTITGLIDLLMEIFQKSGIKYFDVSLTEYIRKFGLSITHKSVRVALEYFLNLRPEVKKFKLENPQWTPDVYLARYNRLIRNFDQYKEYFGVQELNIHISKHYNDYIIISRSTNFKRPSPFETIMVWDSVQNRLIVKKIAKGRRILSNGEAIDEIPYYTQFKMLQALANAINEPVIIQQIVQELIVNRTTTKAFSLYNKQALYGHSQSTKMILGSPNSRNTEDLIYILKYQQDPTLAHQILCPDDFTFLIDDMNLVFSLTEEIILPPNTQF